MKILEYLTFANQIVNLKTKLISCFSVKVGIKCVALITKTVLTAIKIITSVKMDVLAMIIVMGILVIQTIPAQLESQAFNLIHLPAMVVRGHR